MLGVDRLDMIKGFLQKLLAFEKFLENDEGMASKVVLVQIAVPTRSDIPECKVHFWGCLQLFSASYTNNLYD